MDNECLVRLLDLLGEAAARLETYLSYNDPKDQTEANLIEELGLTLENIQIITSITTAKIQKEEQNHG